MANELTDREFWREYWEKYIFTPISDNPIYKNYLPKVKPESSFVEVGGFPGFNAAYFYKHVCKDVTLLDFYVDDQIIRRLEAENKIPSGTIKSIESDFFNFKSDKKYDFVFSSGFIEHFIDTKDVIKRHIDLLSDGGNLLIILPNFKGLNGLVQYLFDRENLLKHNIKSMDISHLDEIMRDFDLEEVKVEYSRKPIVWLEPAPGMWNAVMRKGVKLLSYGIKLFPIKGKVMSPYIVISAKKSA